MAITFPASPSDGAVFTNSTTGVKYIYNATDGVWKTHVWPTNTDYLQLSGGTLTGDLSLGTNDLTVQDVTASGALSANSLSITAGLTVGNGLTVSDGNVVMAAGHGIDFSANTNNGGMTSELFDDYEEGVHTIVTNTNLTPRSEYSVWRYTKIGNQVTMSGLLYVSSVSSTDFVTVSLPFAAAASATNGVNSYTGQPMFNFVDTGSSGLAWYIGSGSSNMAFYTLNDNGSWGQLRNSSLASADELYCTVTYFTDA